MKHPASQARVSTRWMAAAATLLLSLARLSAQDRPVHVTIDASKTGTPISKYLYGQFLEHAGNGVNEGVWAEMLEDRKFYYPINSRTTEENPGAGAGQAAAQRPARPAGDVLGAPPAQGQGQAPARRRRPALRRWMPIGGDEFITMDTSHPFTGEQTPVVKLSSTEAHGFAQSGLAVRAGRAYTGHIQLAASPGAVIQVTLGWGSEPGEKQTVTVRTLGTGYRSYPLRFQARGDSDNAQLAITGTGAGAFHVGTVSLMPANNVEGFRAEVIDALKQLHSGVYRFPGGNFVSSYEWRNGVGDRDKRPPIYDPVWSTAQSNDVGTDEFLTLCRLLGVDPYITVNAGFGDAWSAAELVEYTNGPVSTPMGKWRAANGHPQPYRVKLWGIGNEPWGDYQMGAMSPEQYALKHVLFAKAMRKVDPSITLIAGGAMPDVMEGANQSKRIGGKYVPDLLTPADWSGYLLSHDLDYIDMLSEHYYASGTQHTDMKLEKKVTISPPLTAVEWEREAATQVRVKYEYYRDYEQLIPGLRTKPVPIAIDEWAYTGGGPNSYPVVPALAWAFDEMFRHSDVFKMACFTFATSQLNSTRTTSELNSTGNLFKLYRDHYGSVPVEVGGDSPQPKPAFPAGGDQPVSNPGSPTYPLDVVSALSEDRKTLTFAVINPTESEQSMNLSVAGAQLGSQGHLWQMISRRADAAAPVAAQPGQRPMQPLVPIEEKTLGPVPASLVLPPFSVSVYAYPLQ